MCEFVCVCVGVFAWLILSPASAIITGCRIFRIIIYYAGAPKTLLLLLLLQAAAPAVWRIVYILYVCVRVCMCVCVFVCFRRTHRELSVSYFPQYTDLTPLDSARVRSYVAYECSCSLGALARTHNGM